MPGAISGLGAQLATDRQDCALEEPPGPGMGALCHRLSLPPLTDTALSSLSLVPLQHSTLLSGKGTEDSFQGWEVVSSEFAGNSGRRRSFQKEAETGAEVEEEAVCHSQWPWGLS